MAKKLLLLAFIVLAVALVLWSYLSPSKWHQPIKVDDISNITLWGRTSREATQEDVINIVKWFNSAYDIRNANFVGTTEESGINVVMKNGEKVSIGRSGKDFEVQRKDKRGVYRSYWARQPQLKQLLDNLTKAN